MLKDDGNTISNIIPGQLREFLLEEQTAVKDVQAFKVIAESRGRVSKALKEKSMLFHSYLESSDNFLRSHLGSRVHLVILYAEISYEHGAST